MCAGLFDWPSFCRPTRFLGMMLFQYGHDIVLDLLQSIELWLEKRLHFSVASVMSSLQICDVGLTTLDVFDVVDESHYPTVMEIGLPRSLFLYGMKRPWRWALSAKSFLKCCSRWR